MRSSLLKGSTRLYSCATNKLETFPRPTKKFRHCVTQNDMVNDYGAFKLFRARPEHVPLLVPTFEDFLKNEPTCQGVGVRDIPAELAWPSLFNVTRYPFSYFALNSADEIVSIALQDVVYKENHKAPFPRLPIELTNLRDPLNLVESVLGFAEERHFELLGVERYIHNKVAYTPSVLRRRKINSTIYPMIMKLTAEAAVRDGFQYSVGIVTGEANLRNMAKLNYKQIQRLPEEIYKDFGGKPWLPNGEKPAMLIHMDLFEAHKNRVFEK